jgi:transcriptional regulator with XRE-family HTH domain
LYCVDHPTVAVVLIDADDLVFKVGRRIAELRMDAGLTQEEAAAQARWAWRVWQRLERGQNISLRRMAYVADVLGVRVKSLLTAPEPASRRVKKGRPKTRRAKSPGKSGKASG